MQRFKLCLHGADHNTAVMIGYLQSKEPTFWWGTLNEWIAELVSSNEDTTCEWTLADMLGGLQNNPHNGTAQCKSSHVRTGREQAGPLSLIHLWIDMNLATAGPA